MPNVHDKNESTLHKKGDKKKKSHIIMFVAFLLLVDDQQAVLVHVCSPSIVYSTTVDNESFDKKDQLSMNKMHMVHSRVKMDQYQAKHHHRHKQINAHSTYQFMKTVTFYVNGTSSHCTHVTV